jgi:hypothetical protein
VALNPLRPDENDVFDPLRKDLIIERNSLKGQPIHKIELRVMKGVAIGGQVKAAAMQLAFKRTF